MRRPYTIRHFSGLFRKLLLSSLLAGLTVTFTASANAKCKSAPQMASDLWDAYGEEVKKIGCIGHPLGVMLPEEAMHIIRSCVIDVGKHERIAKTVIKGWNDWVDNSWATLGPRTIQPGKSRGGTLRLGAERYFLTPGPLPVDAVQVEVEKLKFRARTDVTVCAFPPPGPRHGVEGKEVWSFRIGKGTSNKGRVWSRRLEGVKGKVLAIHLNSRAAGKALKYRVSLPIVLETGHDSESSHGSRSAEAEVPQTLRGLKTGAFAQLDGRKFDAGMRLADLEAVGGTLMAVWEEGGGAQRWHADLSRKEFSSKLRDYFRNGMRLVDFEIGEDGFTGVWRSGKQAQWVTWDQSWSDFKTTNTKQFEKGLRLVDVEDRNGRYFGVWHKGSGAQWLHKGMTRKQLQSKDAQYFQRGIRLTDLEKEDGKYTAVWRTGKGSQWWKTGLSAAAFSGSNAERRGEGLAPLDFEVTPDGYLAVWRPVSGRSAVRIQP